MDGSVHAALGQEAESLLRHRGAELLDVMQVRVLLHHLKVPHVGIALAHNVEHVAAWVEEGIQCSGALVQDDQVERLSLLIIAALEHSRVPDGHLPLGLGREAGGDELVVLIASTGASQPLNLGGFGTVMDLASAHSCGRPRIEDPQLLVLAGGRQQRAIVVPLQVVHLVHRVHLEDLVLLSDIPGPNGPVEGRGSGDVGSHRVVGDETDLLAVAFKGDNWFPHRFGEAFVRNVPKFDCRVLAAAQDAVVVEGIELEVQDWP
mmetsp:Transcript_2021/g.4550  ORF Transcript_2021/g.4550 Transcript_2021/m.4550 type:complete len:262 (-) Transcript_2021:318-1103(-)